MGSLISTCKPGSEKQAVLELGDALYRRDPRVAPTQTRYPGTVWVETSIPSFEAYLLIIGRILITPLRLVPLLKPESLPQTLERAGVLSEVSQGVAVRCELRGRRQQCTGLAESLARSIAAPIIARSRARYVLHIEGVDERWGTSVLPRDCDVLERVYADSQLKRRCLGFAKNVIRGARGIVDIR